MSELRTFPLPALLFTGFLGAGKTTLLNRFLERFAARTERIAVLINEFGAEGVDARLLAPGPHAVYEVNRGSIFCVCVRDDFIGALQAIASADPPFDLTLVEATGVAKTRNLNSYLREYPLSGQVRVVRNYCLVDSLNFHKVHATLPAAREQVEEADIVVLSKTTLAGPDSTSRQEALVRELNPGVPLIRWDGGPVDVDSLLPGPEAFSRSSREDLCLAPPLNLRSLTVPLPGVIDPDRLREFMNALPDDLYRAKGIVRLPSGPFLVERTLDGWSIQPLRAFNEGAEGFMVFIARTLDETVIRAGLAACIVSHSDPRE